MKRRQTRLTTEEQITGRIDELKKRVELLLKSSIAEDGMAERGLSEIKRLSQSRNITNAVQEQINSLAIEINKHRDSAVKMNKSRHRIEDATLPKLKDALAAFRTETLAFSKDDPGVVLT